MKKVSTKDRILDSALTLFSERGYDGVGIDLIATNAGLKGPSIYKHYKGKEEILNALIEASETQMAEHYGTERNRMLIPDSLEELVNSSISRIQYSLRDPLAKRGRRLLTSEQFRSRRIALVMSQRSIVGMQRLYEETFRSMMEKGLLEEDDPSLLALEFIAPASLLLQMCDREPDREEEALQKIESHFRHFARKYGTAAGRLALV